MPMEIIDSHHHLWDLGANHYPLLAGPMHERGWGDWSPLRANYLVADFLHDARNQELVKSVHVQANFDPRNPAGETAWLEEVANRPESRGFPHYSDADAAGALCSQSACNSRLRYVFSTT